MAGLDLDPQRTAVLAMDFQESIVANNATVRERGIVERVAGVLEGARRAGMLVVHVVIEFREGYPEVSPRNPMFSGLKQRGMFVAGQPGTAIHAPLRPQAGDLVVSRHRASAFYGSNLEPILRARGVDTLVLMGIATNWVVEAAARTASDLDYRVIVLEDCCASWSAEAHEFSIQQILSQIGEVAGAQDFLDRLALEG
jgi:nicotinamidase-related amidase